MIPPAACANVSRLGRRTQGPSPGRAQRIDQTRVALRELLITEPQSVKNTRAVIAQQNIGLFQQAMEDVFPLRFFQVQSNASLTPIHGQEVMAEIGMRGLRAGNELDKHVAA
jgi:hypothetical protein